MALYYNMWPSMLKEFSCWSIRYNTGILIYKIQSKCRSDYSPYGTKFTRSTIFTFFADKFLTAGGIVFIHAPLPPHWSFRLSSLDYTSSTRFAPLKSVSVGMTPQYHTRLLLSTNTSKGQARGHEALHLWKLFLRKLGEGQSMKIVLLKNLAPYGNS